MRQADNRFPFCTRCGAAARASSRSVRRRRSVPPAAVGAVALAVVLVLAAAVHMSGSARAATLGGAYGRMLAAATDLGPARDDRVRVTAALRGAGRPVRLDAWVSGIITSRCTGARATRGQIEGGATEVAKAFRIAVHNYGPHRTGTRTVVLCLSPAAGNPGGVRGRCRHWAGFSAICRTGRPGRPARLKDVPQRRLLPEELLRAYKHHTAEERRVQRRITVVVVRLRRFLINAIWTALPIGSTSSVHARGGGRYAWGQRSGEATMDLLRSSTHIAPTPNWFWPTHAQRRGRRRV